MSYARAIRSGLVVALVLAGSCSSSTDVGASSAVGAYGLRSINGSVLPYLGLQADTLFLQSDGSVRRFYRENGEGTVYPSEGDYAVSGGVISFTQYSSAVPHLSGDSIGPVSGSLQGSSISLKRDGDVLLYVKK